MSNKNLKIINKYQKIAEKCLVNRRMDPNRKRHDRIGKREAQAIVRAHLDDLSDLKIAELFKRDPRSVNKVINKTRKPGLLDLTILEAGRRVVDFNIGGYARLVKFRIGNNSSNMIVVEKINLQVLNSAEHDKGPRIEAAITPYKYDVELQIGSDTEYMVTEANFKLTRNDFDDYEVLCTSQPGTTYRVLINVSYSKYPDNKILSQCSEEFQLEFPKIEKSSDSSQADRFKLIAAGPNDYQTHLSNFLQGLSEIDTVDLRIYVEKPLSDNLMQAMQKRISQSGANLDAPIWYGSGIVRIIFHFNEALPAAIANIKLPSLLGWQVFDAAGNYLRGMFKFNEGVACLEE